MPSGTSGEHRQIIKFDFLERFANHLKNMRQQQREYIICGDWNIAHANIDLKNWRETKKIPDFCQKNVLGWMNYLILLGFVDAFPSNKSRT